MQYPDRNVRQRDLVPHTKLNTTAVVVIGVGSIGRQVATLIAAMGAPRVTIVDHDTVGEENLAVQGYKPADIGSEKVEVMKTLMEELNPEGIKVHTVSCKYDKYLVPLRGPEDRLVVFCCVDSIDAREMIWNTLRSSRRTADMDLFVDGRMAGEILRVLTWKKGDDPGQYGSTLFNKGEAFPESCTGRSTLYSSYLAAGLMVGEFVKWLRGQTIFSTKDQIFNMVASDLVVLDNQPTEANIDSVTSCRPSAG